MMLMKGRGVRRGGDAGGRGAGGAAGAEKDLRNGDRWVERARRQ